MTLNSFFVGLRQLALSIAIIALIPALSYWSARLISGGFKSNLEWILTPRNSPKNKKIYKELDQADENVNVLQRDRHALLTNESPEGRASLKEIDRKLAVWQEKRDKIKESVDKLEEEHIKLFKAIKLKESQNIFICSAIIGLASIIFGVLTSITYLGAGFIIGGICSLSMGYYFYWNYLYDLLKFASLLAAILLILVMSYYFMKKEA